MSVGVILIFSGFIALAGLLESSLLLLLIEEDRSITALESDRALSILGG